MKDWWQATFPKGRQTLIISDVHGYPVQIAYGERGTGKPLFLIHGMGNWSYNWRYSIAPLSQHFRVICFDTKGFGFSDKPWWRREQNGHQVIELERIIQTLCDEPAIIVGESIGALIALALAQKNPQLIARLVVMNVPIFAERLPHWAMEILSQTPLEVLQAIDHLRLAYLFAPLVREVMAIERRKVLFNPSILTPEDIYWISYPFIEIPGTLVKVAEELQIAAREIKHSQGNKPNILTQIQSNLVGSRGRIIVRPSLLEPDVQVSQHPAPDVLGLRFCSCGCNRGSFREQQEGSHVSNCYGFHQHDEDVPSRH